MPFLKVRFVILFYLTLLCSLLLSTTARAEKPHIQFSTFVLVKDSVVGKICELTFTEAFRRMGMTFSVTVLPLKRAAREISNGNIDGDLGRSFEFGKDYPNIIRLNESFINVKLVAFTKKENIKINGVKSFKNSQMRIRYIYGSTILQNLLSKEIPPSYISTSIDRFSALRMLMKGRIDIYLDGELDILKILLDPQFKNSGIYNAGTIIDIPIYPFLSIKHKKLIPKLIQVLREMRAEGLIKKYTKMAFNNSFP